MDEVSPYYNVLPGGTEIDLTREQFARRPPTEPTTRRRAYVLSVEPTRRRYQLLLQRHELTR